MNFAVRNKGWWVYRWMLKIALSMIRFPFGANIISEWVGEHLSKSWGYNYKSCLLNIAQENESDSKKRNIRLLKVEFAGTITGVRCSLTTLEDLQSHDYHCLSYTWGETFDPDLEYIIRSKTFVEKWLGPLVAVITKTRRIVNKFCQPKSYTINIDEGFLTVTPNLWHALITLHETRPEELKAIWIDAICINQKDVKEKTAQVSIMHHIYNSAKSVVVWLGPENKRNEDPSMVQDVIDALHKQDEASPGFCKSMSDWTWNEDFNEFPAPDEIRFLGFEHWFYVRNFLQRKYFKRIWTFQEMILAQKIIITCGKRNMSWENLRNISQAFSKFGVDIMTRYSRPGKWAGEANGPHRTAIWRDKRLVDVEAFRKLFGHFVLEMNRNGIECTDGRDMLYGYGVCNNTRIKPDYSKTVAQVYSEFWTDVLQRIPGAIDFLTHVEDSSASTNRQLIVREKLDDDKQGTGLAILPSWVPDFQAPCEPKSMATHYDTGSFSVSGDLPEIRPYICDIDYRLTLHGFIFNTIVETSESGTELLEKTSIVRLLNLMLNLLREHGKIYPTNENSLEAVWKSMAILTDITGAKDIDYPPPPSTRETFKKWLLYILALPKVLRSKRNPENATQDKILEELRLLNPSTLIPSLEEIEEQAETHSRFLNAKVLLEREGRSALDDSLAMTFRSSNNGHVGMTATVFGDVALERMRVFRTEGGYVGKGHQQVEVGDVVVVFSGAAVPFVLRAKGCGKWKFVGQAFVYGIMDGGYSKRWEGLEQKEFVIE